MLRRYPSIARRFPHRKSVDGHQAASRTNAEKSNHPCYDVMTAVVDHEISTGISTSLGDNRDVAARVISVTHEGKQLDFRDDSTSASIPTEGPQSFNGESGHSLSQL